MTKMNSNKRTFMKVATAAFTAAMFAAPLLAQNKTIRVVQFHYVESDAARELFNTGRDYYDSEKYLQAENAFREVLQKYAKNAVADRSAYYLIRTLGEQGKIEEAKNQIAAFQKTYPKSNWMKDVLEYQARLTNQINSPLIFRTRDTTPVALANAVAAAAAAVASIQVSTPAPP